MDMVNEFHEWDREALVQYALSASEQIEQQNAEMDALRADLRVAIDAYRALINKTK